MRSIALFYHLGVSYQIATKNGCKGIRARIYGMNPSPSELRAFDLGRSRDSRGLA